MSTGRGRPNDNGRAEHDLERLQPMWTELESPEPPELLDQAVLNAARRELARNRRRKPLRWIGALATASVLVLALAVVVRQERQATAPPGERMQLERRAGRPAAAEEAPARSRADLLELQVPESRDATAPEPDAAAPVQHELYEVAPSPEFGTSAAAKKESLQAPEQWLERLLSLQAEGREQELTAGLDAFREAYPDYPLPPELEGR